MPGLETGGTVVPPESMHPGSTSMSRFAQGVASGAEMRGVVVHLLRGCKVCGETLAEVAPELVLSRPLKVLESQYVASIERVANLARVRKQELRREHANSRGFLSTLYEQPKARKLLLLRNSERGRAWTVCEELLEASFELRRDDPMRMVELAEMAFRVASELDCERYGKTQIIDLQARTAAELANAFRVAEKLELALQVMIGAMQLLHHGSGDPLLRARVYELASSILRYRRRGQLTRDLLERAYRIYRRFDEDHLAGRILLKRAVTEGYLTEPQVALELLVEAVELIDPQEDRRLAWEAIHNLLWGLVDMGRYEAAAELLAESQELYDEFSTRLNVFVRIWLEGRIDAGLGRDHEAETQFFSAVEGFTQLGKHLDAATVAMDYALILGRQGRVQEVRSLVNDIVATFRSMKMEREAIAALLLLKDALHRQRVPFLMIKKMQEYLRRLPQEPGLRFDQVFF